MLELILDPSREGCHLWHRSYVTSIKGNFDEVCIEIYKRVTIYYNTTPDKMECKQSLPIYLDVTGIGKFYKDVLTSMGLTVREIRPKNIDMLLPVLNKDMKPVTKEPEEYMLSNC